MSRRTRQPEEKTLHISQGDWLLVKKYLTAGEQRNIFRGMIRDGATGDKIDSINVGLSTMCGYLLDWSFTDHTDKPIVILNKPKDVLVDALNSLDPAAFTEVLRAIEAHEAEMEKEREKEKNDQGGDHKSSPISTSPSVATGAMSGSENLTLMSTTS